MLEIHLYMDDICLGTQARTFAELEFILTADTAHVEEHCHYWQLTPSISKTVSSVFHLHNDNSARELALCRWTANTSNMSHIQSLHHHHHNHFTALFPGPPGSAGARTELLDFMVQWKINRGRHTDYPAECHSIRANQCPPPPSLHVFYRPDALPAAQPTVSKHWRHHSTLQHLTRTATQWQSTAAQSGHIHQIPVLLTFSPTPSYASLLGPSSLRQVDWEDSGDSDSE